MGRLKSTLRGRFWREHFATFRHCFRCGQPLQKRYVLHEKSRRLVCVGCGEITYINPKVVAGLIPVMPGGRVVLLRRAIEPAKGRWTYPAGFQEMGESVAEAAARETQEEICTKVIVKHPIGVYSYADAGVVTIVYAGTVKRGQRPRVGHEAEAVEIFSLKDIPWTHLAFRSTTDSLKDWLRLVKK